ncbi:class I SAM-dependent methyltransferase [bacterium]|nr:class I SAM-dependent methyltransferase [bacterium]
MYSTKNGLGTPVFRPLDKVLGSVTPSPERVLLIRCAPEPLVRFALGALERSFPRSELTVLCRPGQELAGCNCLVCPGEGFLRLEDLDTRSRRAIRSDLALIPCSTTRRLCSSYHNVNRLAAASGARWTVHLHSDRLASRVGPRFLERLEREVHAPFLAIKQAALAELALFTGEDLPTVERKCDLAGLRAVSLWQDSPPADANSVRRFYQEHDFYLYELMKTEYNGDEAELNAEVLSLCSPGERVLDYGGGCGSLSLELARKGCRVTHLDLPGPLLDFAAWRFASRKLPVRIHPLEREGELGGPYDKLINIFVLEHLFDPESALRAMRRAVVPGGQLLIAVDFEESAVKTAPLPLHLCRLSRTRYAELTAELGLTHLESRGALDVFETSASPALQF